MRGVNPSHINACFPKLPGIKTPAASSEGRKSEASGGKAKKQAYPDQPNGILKKGPKSKFSGAAKEKSNPGSADPGSSKPETSNARRVSFNPESEAHEEAGPSAPPASPQSPAVPGNPAHRIQPLDRYLAEHGARPMTLADHLERPLTPSTLSPSDSFLNSPTRMFPSPDPSFDLPGSVSSASTPERPGVFGAWNSPSASPTSSFGSARLSDDVHIPGTPDSAGSPAHRPGQFGTWKEGPALPQPPTRLRAGWDSSSGSSAGSQGTSLSNEAHMFDTPTSPGSPAQAPGRFGTWNSPAGSPTASAHQDIQPGLTRTASEVGALFGGENVESGRPAAHAAPTPPTAEGEGRRPVGGLLSKNIGGAVLAAGTAAAIALAIELGGQGGNGQ